MGTLTDRYTSWASLRARRGPPRGPLKTKITIDAVALRASSVVYLRSNTDRGFGQAEEAFGTLAHFACNFGVLRASKRPERGAGTPRPAKLERSWPGPTG
jgi:hypothetical protein